MTDISDQLHDYLTALSHRLVEEVDARGGCVPPTPPPAEQPRKKRHALVYAAAAVALVLVAVALFYGQPHPGHPVATSGTEVFIPKVSTRGTSTNLPLVFPDGSSVDLVYPRSARLQSPGFFPDASVQYNPYGTDPPPSDSASPSPCCGRTLFIERGTISEAMDGLAPTKYYRGARGQRVPFFDSSAGPTGVPELGFQFGSWVVLAYDYPVGDPRGVRMTDQQRALFAASLDGYESSGGFLILRPKQPLCLQPSSDEPDGTLGATNSGVLFFLAPFNHGQGEVNVGLSARGDRMVTWGPYVSLLSPTRPFELALPASLHSLRNDIQITNVHQVTQWRC